MIPAGIVLPELKEQFARVKSGRTLIMDGDGPAYRFAASVKRLDTAVRKFQTEVLTQMFMAGAETCTVHLTHRDSKKAGRFNVRGVKPYQGQRQGKAKPSLLEPLKDALGNMENWLPEFTVLTHKELEADDGMMIQAYQLKDDGVIWSDDKDLRMTPYPYYDMAKGKTMPGEPFGWLQPKLTPSGTVKVIGQGPLFFWAQMLMGDTADNIKGILRYDGKLCGPALTYSVLGEAKDINEAANIVLDAYRSIDQNPIPEGWLLWMLRHPHDNFWVYLTELDLSNENKEFLNECRTRDWYGADAEAGA